MAEATAAGYAWFADHWLRQAFCFSLVRRLDEVEVLRRLGGERSQPRTLGEAAELSGSFHAGYPKLVLAARVGGWVVAVDDNGWEGARPEVGDVGRCLAALAVAASTGQHHDLPGPSRSTLPRSRCWPSASGERRSDTSA